MPPVSYRGHGPIREAAPAKVNLLLHVGSRRPDGLHEICSLFASIDLFDHIVVSPAPDGRDTVSCDAVEGTNICSSALAAFREAAVDATRGGGAAELPPLAVRIEKRIPVAAGLGGGSADAAAVLRVANRLAGDPLEPEALRRVGAAVGADVPSQVEPGHALVQGAGEVVEPIPLPAMWLVLMPSRRGLATGDVYAEADRLGAGRERLAPMAARALAGARLAELAEGLENDLERAALSLRPALARTLTDLWRLGALASLVSGSGPTVFGVFGERGSAEEAAASLPGSLVVRVG